MACLFYVFGAGCSSFWLALQSRSSFVLSLVSGLRAGWLNPLQQPQVAPQVIETECVIRWTLSATVFKLLDIALSTSLHKSGNLIATA